MAGRHRNPDTNYKVALRVTGPYRYAATQPNIVDPVTGQAKRKFVYWGDVTEDMKFIPNSRYRLASEEERKKLIFPENWDMSEVQKRMNSEMKAPVSADPYIANDGSAFSGTVSTVPSEGQFNNRFYGGPWLLWEVAVKKNVVEDLLSVFENHQSVVNDIMTLAMFPILTKGNYSQVEKWQRYTMTPSNHPLSSKYITQLTQSIHDTHRMQFLKLRIKRQTSGALVACDSTSRSAYGRCLADIRWGNNKDNAALQNTLEVVVYSLDTHEPIYYRTFAGNENDSRTLRTIVSDLAALGCKELTIIFDRGYETEENILNMIRGNQSFLVCSKVGQTPVIDEIRKIQFGSNGIPEEMEYNKEYGLYGKQAEIKKTLMMNPDDPSTETTVSLKVNLFLEIHERMQELIKISEAIKAEKKILSDLTGKPCNDEKLKALKKECPHYVLKADKEKRLTAVLNEKKVQKENAVAGFFSSISYKIDGGVFDHYEYYLLRDEQEKYFESMKDQLGFNMQRNWSEGGKTGRLFILFIGLIIQSEIRSVWKNKLKDDYPSSIDVLHEMVPVRYVEYEDGSTHITGFTTPQVKICRAMDIPIPEDCLSVNQKAMIDRAKAGRKRGRPKGSLNKKKSAVVF